MNLVNICGRRKMDVETDLSEFYFNPEIEIIAGKVVPPITESHNFDYDAYPSVVERYYTKHYYFPNDNIDNAHTVLNHSNGICLIGLADTHEAVKKGIKSLTYDVGNFDRSKNQVVGKAKRGALNLQNTTTLAEITCEDGSTYRIYSALQGKLVEVNERIVENPKLIGTDGDGYVAVVLPKLDKCKDQVEKLANEEEYQARLKEKSNEIENEATIEINAETN